MTRRNAGRATRTRFTVFVGTRPEAIKLAPVIRALAQEEWAEARIVSTGQHQSLLRAALDDLGLECHRQLTPRRHEESLNELTSRLLVETSGELACDRPDMVIVQGDTTSALSVALAAFHAATPVAHVEAGLRTYRDTPYPEEMNRQVIARLARLHFAPTPENGKNLVREGIAPEAVFVTGNTSIDEIRRRTARSAPAVRRRPTPEKLLVTAHRRESWGVPMREIRAALTVIATRHPELSILFPIHVNPKVRAAFGVHGEETPRNIHFVEPPGPDAFFELMLDADLVLTDSGGLQEEAPALGKPTLVMRNATERPEALHAGSARLVGTWFESIVSGVEALLEGESEYQGMARPVSPFGDGRAAERIVDVLRSHWCRTARETSDFAAAATAPEERVEVHARPADAARLAQDAA